MTTKDCMLSTIQTHKPELFKFGIRDIGLPRRKPKQPYRQMVVLHERLCAVKEYLGGNSKIGF